MYLWWGREEGGERENNSGNNDFSLTLYMDLQRKSNAMAYLLYGSAWLNHIRSASEAQDLSSTYAEPASLLRHFFEKVGVANCTIISSTHAFCAYHIILSCACTWPGG